MGHMKKHSCHDCRRSNGGKMHKVHTHNICCMPTCILNKAHQHKCLLMYLSVCGAFVVQSCSTSFTWSALIPSARHVEAAAANACSICLSLRRSWSKDATLVTTGCKIFRPAKCISSQQQAMLHSPFANDLPRWSGGRGRNYDGLPSKMCST